MFQLLQNNLNKAIELSWVLFKIMIPIIIAIKIFEELGLIHYLSLALEPVMEMVGLPGAMGLVWATALVSNLYGGIVVFANVFSHNPMTVAQVTIICSMMLIAHALPIEGRIAQKAGVPLWFTLVLRIGGAILFAWIVNALFLKLDYLQQPAELLWQAPQADTGLIQWMKSQLIGLAVIFLIVFALVLLLDLLKKLGVIDFITTLLRPLLHLLGIGRQAETITLVGLTLGISYGGALLIKEVTRGHIPKADVFLSISLLGLSHSLIEDTLLMMLIGGHLSGILLGRVIFSVVVTYILVMVLKKRTFKIKGY